jgi:hypothetical protein
MYAYMSGRVRKQKRRVREEGVDKGEELRKDGID